MSSKITNRYASAIRSGRLVSDPDTTMSDTDVLGAFGLAGKETRNVLRDGQVQAVAGEPIAVALQRYLLGDDKNGHQLVRLLGPMVWSRARDLGTKPAVRRVEATDIATAVLGWYRDPRCKKCSGHGYAIVSGVIGSSRAVVGNQACRFCEFGKRPLLREFRSTRRDLVQWLQDLIERKQSAAGAAAMQALAPLLDFLQPR